MKRHREITISSPSLDAAALARYVESFAQYATNWECPLEKSQAYERACGEPSCCVVVKAAGFEHAAVHLSRIGPNALRKTNIVPLDLYELNIDQYNAIATEFSRALRKQAGVDKKEIRVSISKANTSLSDIVTGKYPIKFLNQYLGAYPLSGHPSDIERLDKFICSLSRYSKKPFDFHAFQHLLVEELGWSEAQAETCRSRVEIGLEVLATNKRF